uniref:Alpha/beta hydrolase fold-3 domain-containing protein n=1 Tax=Triticum urartu TaxID=4572 RepID=A0A8R7P920_TRIUA
MYVHGRSFCTESAFCRTYHNYARSLAARAGALIVSVEYRLAPEHTVPMAYDDAWAALQWVASLSDPWLSYLADPGRTFLAGDSAGGNIVYNTAVRAATGVALATTSTLRVLSSCNHTFGETIGCPAPRKSGTASPCLLLRSSTGSGRSLRQ